MTAYAHSHPAIPMDRWHLLEDHLREVGSLAARFAAPFHSAEWAKLAGEWHDLGKYAPDFQKKLRHESNPDLHIEDASMRVDHSSAGALLARDRFGLPRGSPLSWVIAGHHAGLDDRVRLFKERLQAKAERLTAAMDGEPPEALVNRAEPLWPSFVGNDPRRIEFWIRFLFSALVDADFLDTEAWFARADADARNRLAAREGAAPSLRALRDRLSAHLDQMDGHGQGAVQELRSRVLRACRTAGRDPQLRPGFFSLTVPTGGGKTLSSLMFALEHGLTHDLRRVIAVIPFTSIIEQSADAFRHALGDGSAVIEHHSALDTDDPSKETWRTRVASENWDAPLVVTTSVQFFESLFSNRTSRCRKLHNVAKSVVILDECQTLPRELLAPITWGLRELVQNYGVSVVLCTATQPVLDLPDIRELIPPGEVGSNFNLSRARVQVKWPASAEPEDWSALGRRVAAEPSALAIVHLRDDARKLAEAVDRAAGLSSTFHLSALMCPVHRRRVLSEVRQSLERGEPTKLVSTQLVEAGVDIDFPVVFRALAGVDSLAQAAGRCNREGRLKTGRLEVFMAPTSPPMGILKQGLNEMIRLLRENPALDLFDLDVYRRYFRDLYGVGTLDREEIEEARERLAFREVAAKFRMIPDTATPIVVPLDDACREALQWIRADRPIRRAMQKLQGYSVNVYRKGLEALEASAALEYLPSRERCLVRALRQDRMDLYDERLGLLGATASIPLIA